MTHQQAIDGLASERYLLDEMSDVERFEFEAHYFDCADCAEDVRLGDVIRQEARRAGATERVDGESHRAAKVLTAAQWWKRPMVAAPWAAAAALALTVGYQSFVTTPSQGGSDSAQSLEPVMLRGATRGVAPVVNVARGQRFVALSADILSAPASAELTYEIVDATRAVVASGKAPVPSSGAPLLLLVPVDELQKAGHHTLILREVDQNTVIGEYEFDVSY